MGQKTISILDEMCKLNINCNRNLPSLGKSENQVPSLDINDLKLANWDHSSLSQSQPDGLGNV